MAPSRKIIAVTTRALFPRLLFFSHGFVCVWLLVKQELENNYWYLMFCLAILVCEGVFNAFFRHGKEFHWVCPSAFLYCIVLIVTMVVLREAQKECIRKNLGVPKDKYFCAKDKLNGTDHITKVVNSWNTDLTKRISLIEQTGMLVLIFGRWLLPQGSISRDQFSKIILIYVGTAADIVEFSEIYGEEDLGEKLNDQLTNVVRALVAVWALSVLQFSLTIALPEEGLKEKEHTRDENEIDIEESSYFRSKMQDNTKPMSYMHYKNLILKNEDQITNHKSSVRTNQVLPSIIETQSNRNENAALTQMITIGINGGMDRSHSTEELLPSPANTERISAPRKLPAINQSLTKGGNRLSHAILPSKSPNIQQFRKRNNSMKLRNKTRDKNENIRIDIDKDDVKSCFHRHITLIKYLIPVVMQDGPFFIARFVLVAHFEVITEMIFLLIVKNGLVITLHFYRIILLYCDEQPDKGADNSTTYLDDDSIRVRAALKARRESVT